VTEQAHDAGQLQRAQVLIQLRRWDEAETLLRRLVATSPEDVTALRLLAAALNDSGRPADALPVIRRAVALAPDSPATHAVLSTVERANGDLDAAAAAADRTVQLAPHWPIGHARRAWALADRDPQAAMAAARRAVELAPDQADPLFVLGYAALKLNLIPEAEKAFRAALAIDPGHSMALNNLAVLDIRRKNIRAALAGFRGAVGIDPRNQTAATNFEAIGRRVVQECLRWFAVVSIAFLFGSGAAGSGFDADAIAVRRRFVAVAAYVLWWAALAFRLRVIPRGQLKPLVRMAIRGQGAPACFAMATALVVPVAGVALGWTGVVGGTTAAAVTTILVRLYYVGRYLGQRARGSH
jgi:tetratricopeptide (TPR) repeat protein